MDIKKAIAFLRAQTLGALLANLALAVGILLVVSIFFLLRLPAGYYKPRQGSAGA